MRIKFNITYFIIWVLIVLWFNYKLFFGDTSLINTNTSTNTTYKVDLWDIKKSINVVWNSQLVDEQSLSFNKVWTITKVNFKPGDSIKKWDIIAEIDNSDAYTSIDDAQLNLDNAKISLNDLYKWAEQTQILQAQNNIDTSQFNLEIAKKQLDNLKITQKNILDKLLEWIDTSKKDLASSLSNLELSKNDLELQKKQIGNSLDNTVVNKNTTIQNIEDSFRWNLVDAQKMIQDWDYIMWVSVENRDRNDSFESYLWAKNSSAKTSASSTLSEAFALYEKLKSDLDNYKYDWNKDTITNLLNSYLALYNKIYEASDYVYKAADSSIISIWWLSDTQINTMKSTMSSDRSSSLSKITSIKAQINSLKTLTDTDLISQWNDNTIASKEASIKSQELNIEKSKLDIKNLIKSYDETVSSQKIAFETSQKDIDNKERSLEVAKLNLSDLLKWPTDSNVRKAQNTIKQAELKLSTAKENLADYNLIAPFDWVVRKIDYMVWDNLSTDTWKFVYIENPNLLEITVMLDQIDIVSVKVGSEALVTFDAYPTIPVKAKITSIDTTPTEGNWVVTYEVKIVLVDPWFAKKILSWMTTNIEIITEQKQNILVIKNTAISEKNWKKYVILQNNWTELETEIQTWIFSWWFTEVVSWLKQWDIVVIKDFSSVNPVSTATPASTSLFSVPTWRGSGWGWWNGWFRQN